MSEDISSPLLSLIRENGLIDDLQYEEVAGELKRNASAHDGNYRASHSVQKASGRKSRSRPSGPRRDVPVP